MAEDDDSPDWGRTALKILGIVAVVVGVPTLLRDWSDKPALDYIIADSDRQEGRYDEAIAKFTDLIKADPGRASAYSGRGDSYREKGDLDRAFADLNEAIRLNPRLAEAYFYCCRAWRRTGEIDRAVADCDEATRIKPDDPAPNALAARMLLERGDTEAARVRLDAAVRLQGENSGEIDNRFYRGQIALFHQNRPAEAAADFAAALKRAFDYRGVGVMIGSPNVLMAYRHPFVPDGYYLVMWQHIARVRAGGNDAEELAANVKKLTEPVERKMLLEVSPTSENEILAATLRPWPGRFIALYLGKVTPDSIRAAAEATADPDIRRRRVCDVDFYLGEYAIETGAAEDARKLLRAAADGCPASAPEAAFAKAEIKRLGS